MASEISEAIAAMILERQQTRETETATRRSKAQADRVTFKRRRDAGLIRRHAAKLARNAQQSRTA